MDKEEIIRLIRKVIRQEERGRIHQWDIVNQAVKQRHLEGLIIFTGLAADRPDGSTEVKAWFSTDTGDLSIWDGTSWLTVNLS